MAVTVDELHRGNPTHARTWDGDGVLDEQELACSLYDTDGDGQLSNIELCMKKYDKVL